MRGEAAILFSVVMASIQVMAKAVATTAAIRCVNGRKHINQTFLTWVKIRGIRLEFIQPGKPPQNANIERYNRTVRCKWLAHRLFDSIEEVQALATQWLWAYNHERLDEALLSMISKQKLAMAAWHATL